MTPPLHAIVLWSFRILSKAIYFHNLSSGSGISGVIVITVRV
jgi:hypothetical protein